MLKNNNAEMVVYKEVGVETDSLVNNSQNLETDSLVNNSQNLESESEFPELVEVVDFDITNIEDLDRYLKDGLNYVIDTVRDGILQCAVVTPNDVLTFDPMIIFKS